MSIFSRRNNPLIEPLLNLIEAMKLHNRIARIVLAELKKKDTEIAELRDAYNLLARRVDNKTGELSKRIDRQEGVHGAR